MVDARIGGIIIHAPENVKSVWCVNSSLYGAPTREIPADFLLHVLVALNGL